MVKQKYPRMTSKPANIHSKFFFDKITKCEGVVNYKIIRKIHCKKSKCINHPVRIGRRTTWYPRDGNATSHTQNYIWVGFSSLGLSPTISSSANQCRCSCNYRVHTVSCSPNGPIARNVKCGRYPEAAFFGSLEEKYFKGQRQAYINYANRTLVGVIQHLYDDHRTISPMGIDENDQKIRQ